MSKEDELSPAEFLMFAGGNQDRSSFLLGYIVGHVPPRVLYRAALARQEFEDAGAAFSTVLDILLSEVYDPRD